MYYDWKDIPDWTESLAARPHELGHFKKPYKEYGTSYAEAWRRWVRDDVTQDNEHGTVQPMHLHGYAIQVRRNMLSGSGD